MRLLIQRVKMADVRVDGLIIGKIGPGILGYLGIHKDDASASIPWFVNKFINLRIFEDNQGKMNLNLQEVKGEVLLVSQFTLYANCLNGRRPDFIEAAPPNKAQALYEEFIDKVRATIGKVETGQFGAYMQVSSINDGPVTLLLEEKKA